MKKLFLLIALTIVLSNSYAAIRGVPGSYATIQAAIDASVNTDTVLVEPGTYYENINFKGKNIVVSSRFYITGDPATIYSTIINGSNPSVPDSASCVRIFKHEDSTCVLQGFNITGGKGTKWQDEHSAGRYREGGGILVDSASPTIRFNIIHDNILSVDGGPIVSRGGGGMRIGDCYVRLYNNEVYGNTGIYGPGIVLNFAGCDMQNNVVCYNYGSTNLYGGGSGMWINSNSTRPKVIRNNTIMNNNSASGTGGIYIYGAPPITFKNNILWGNSGSAQISGGVSASSVTYCDVQGGVTGAGNINSDPMITDSTFYLGNSSPCVDAGDSSTIYNDPEDTLNPGFALLPSRGTVRNDMGAFGGPLTKVLDNQVIGINQISTLVPSHYILMQNYPNPFNPVTSIIYQIQKSGIVSLRLYDITGKLISVLVNSFQSPGTFKYDLNASNMPSGVYFYRLESNGFSQTRKMILLK